MVSTLLVIVAAVFGAAALTTRMLRRARESTSSMLWLLTGVWTVASLLTGGAPLWLTLMAVAAAVATGCMFAVDLHAESKESEVPR
jgi:hypothetical protein